MINSDRSRDARVGRWQLRSELSRSFDPGYSG